MTVHRVGASLTNSIHTAGWAYVAAPFGNWEKAREAQEKLRDYGYSITYDWTPIAAQKDAQAQEWKGRLDHDEQRDEALREVEAVKSSDLTVFVLEGFPDGGIGCYAEFGVAICMGAKVDVIGPPRNSIFWHLPTVEVHDSIEAWIPR